MIKIELIEFFLSYKHPHSRVLLWKWHGENNWQGEAIYGPLNNPSPVERKMQRRFPPKNLLKKRANKQLYIYPF